MRGIAGLPLVMALAQLLHLSLATPTLQTSTSPLLDRSQYCFNAPGTRDFYIPSSRPFHSTSWLTFHPTRSLLSRRTLGGIPPGPIPPPVGAHPISHGNSPNELIIWCQGKSRTYISATWQSPLIDVSWSTAQSVLAVAIAMVHQHLAAGDGPLVKGAFQYGIKNAQVQAANSNNHQLTWGVLGAALDFSVMDGENEIGQGFFDNEAPPSAAPPSGS